MMSRTLAQPKSRKHSPDHDRYGFRPSLPADAAVGQKRDFGSSLALRPRPCLRMRSVRGPSDMSQATSSVAGFLSNRLLSPLTESCRKQDPFAPRSLPASPLLWAPPTPGRAARRLCLPAPRLRPSLPPNRVSQVPRLICPRALSPTTPEGPMAAYVRCFTIGGGLHLIRQAGHPPLRVTRPKRVRLRYGSRVRSAGLRPGGSLRRPPASLPAERTIRRATSFQIARSARLGLAHRKARRTRKEKVSRSSGLSRSSLPGLTQGL